MADKQPKAKRQPKQPPKTKPQQAKPNTDRSKRFISSNPDDMFG